MVNTTFLLHWFPKGLAALLLRDYFQEPVSGQLPQPPRSALTSSVSLSLSVICLFSLTYKHTHTSLFTGSSGNPLVSDGTPLASPREAAQRDLSSGASREQRVRQPLPSDPWLLGSVCDQDACAECRPPVVLQIGQRQRGCGGGKVV